MTTTTLTPETATVTPLAAQPAPGEITVPVRTWSVSTAGGFIFTGYLPPWADEDPSDTEVSLERPSVKLIDLAHWRPFDGQRMRVHHPALADDAGNTGDVEDSLFGGHIVCYSYSEDPQERTPCANVRVVDDFWLNNLTPEDLTTLAAKLRTQADHLEKAVAPVLQEARNDWTARRIGRANYVLP